jgi:hypothetical protein
MSTQHDQAVARTRFGGADGNEALTSAAACVLTVLLAAEGLTLFNVSGLRTPHMVLGIALIGPLLVKLASTAYRMVRYYAGARPYREKGPPLLALRLLAPVLVAATLGVFGTGVGLLVVGHRSDLLMQLHQITFIVWGVLFGVHFLAYLPRMARSLSSDWTTARRRQVRGALVRLSILTGSLAAGAGLAVALLSAITGWHGDGGS